nr:C25 family cysteine peptidase [Saprospiraceae bacterium]
LEYVNIIGKGREYFAIRTAQELADPINASYFVPSYGNSPSDFLLFSDGAYPNPYFAIGRIAARNMEEVGNYLEKLKVHDSAIKAPQTKDKLWLKRILHLSGGGTVDEQVSIKNYLYNMETEIENNMFGAEVLTFQKASNAPVQSVEIDKIKKVINNGISVVNFFGHASVGTLDYDLGAVDQYSNKGKLPFIFSLGCYSGNICTSSGSGVSESWVLAKDIGAIGYIASSGSAYLNTQGVHGIEFYESLGNEFYNESIGNMLKLMNERHKNELNIGKLNLLQQFTLHSDPAVRIHGFEKPDFTIDYESISTSPKVVQVTDRNVEIDFNILDIGKAIEDSLKVRLIHIGPKGDTIQIFKNTIISPKYSENWKAILNLENQEIVGKNIIKVELDPENSIPELDEENNFIQSPDGSNEFIFYILDGGLRPVFPTDFSIVNDSQLPLKLIATSSNAFNQRIEYTFQIDTTENFNSSQLIESHFSENSNYVEWKPNINLIANTVYYWRISPDTLIDGNKMWTSRSFVYLPNSSEGWNQSHYQQFLKDDLELLKISENGAFDFEFVNMQVSVKSEIYNGSDNIPYTVVAGQKWGALTPFNGTRDLLNIIVWEDAPKLNITGHDYGCLPWDANAIFPFDVTKESGRSGIKQLLEDAKPNANIWVFFTLKGANADLKIEDWAQDSTALGYNLFSLLESYGATHIRELQDRGTVPYILYFTKDQG